MFWVCVFSQSFITLRLRPPLERSTARETRSRTRSVFVTICVLSELHDFATETTSGAVDRSRDGFENEIHVLGVCALRAS